LAAEGLNIDFGQGLAFYRLIAVFERTDEDKRGES